MSSQGYVDRIRRLGLTDSRTKIIDSECVKSVKSVKSPSTTRADRPAWQISREDACRLAANTSRDAILTNIANLEARAAIPGADPMYRRIAGYQRQILAAWETLEMEAKESKP